MVATTMVEVVGWGPRVAEAVSRLEQAFALMFVGLLVVIFTVAWAATAVAFRR